MTTPALRVEAIQDVPEIELVETTVDDLITTADPLFARNCGYAAGQLWSMSQTRIPDGFLFFVNWWMANREKLDHTALQQAAAHILQNPKISEQESLNWWNMRASMLPPADQPEALMNFLDGFRWGCRDGFEKLRQLKRQAAENRRKLGV